MLPKQLTPNNLCILYVDSLTLYHSVSTLFFTESEGEQDSVSGIVARSIPPPTHNDQVAIYRICQLTKVLLDSRVSELGGKDVHTFTIIAPSDRKEVEAARRTLHEYVLIVF